MATATSMTAAGVVNAFDTIAASTSGSLLVAAPGADTRVRVLGFQISCGGTASTVQFKSGSTAIGPVFQNSISSSVSERGWFQTAAGQALNVDTGTGSNTGVLVLYALVKA